MALKATAAENLKSRERKLREDSMCVVLNPKRVQCNQCNIQICLSKKSDYDPCHWNKHRERCLRRKPNGLASGESRGGRPLSLTISEFPGTYNHHHFSLPILPLLLFYITLVYTNLAHRTKHFQWATSTRYFPRIEYASPFPRRRCRQ